MSESGLFSSRQRRLEQGNPSAAYPYDPLPASFRVQVTYIWNRAIGRYNSDLLLSKDEEPVSNALWKRLHDWLAEEKGLDSLGNPRHTKKAQFVEYFRNASTLDALDALEMSFFAIEALLNDLSDYEKQQAGITEGPVEAIAALNRRFQEHGLGYEYTGGEIVTRQPATLEGAKAVVQLTKPQALTKIDEAVRELDKVKSEPPLSPAFNKWRRDTEVAISYIFPDRPNYLEEFKGIQYNPQRRLPSSNGEPDSREASRRAERFTEGMEEARSMLLSMVDQIRDYWPDDAASGSASSGVPRAASLAPSPQAQASAQQPAQARRKVFVIFGHDIALKDQIVTYLYRVRLEPVLLSEQAGGGRTLIQMLHDNADVDYAIALLTPDDVGAAATAFPKAPPPVDDVAATLAGITAILHPRARQNVIFELGLFQGMHGQGGVCVILGKDAQGRRVERPTDIEGIRYLPVEGESGMGLLGLLRRELLQAGLELDLAAG